MTKMSFSVPHPLAEWARKQAADGRYADTGEYLSELLHKDRERQQKFIALQDAITAGIKSPNAGILDIDESKRRAKAHSVG